MEDEEDNSEEEEQMEAMNVEAIPHLSLQAIQGTAGATPSRFGERLAGVQFLSW